MSVQLIVGFANWLVKEQFGNELSQPSRDILINYLSNVFLAYHDDLASECAVIILEYFGRVLKKKELFKELLSYVKDIEASPAPDGHILLALLFSAHLCIKHTVEHDVYYDLSNLVALTPGLKGLDYMDCETFFLKALDWNLTPRVDAYEAAKFESNVTALACYFSNDQNKKGSIHPWQFQIGINKENVLSHNLSQPARTFAYQFLQLEKPENPYLLRSEASYMKRLCRII
jgi:hypothetical protein